MGRAGKHRTSRCLPGPARLRIRLYARDGATGLGELTDRGDLHFLPLRRVRIHRIADKNGRYRWYGDYDLSDYTEDSPRMIAVAQMSGGSP